MDQLSVGYGIMFVICALAYISAWVIMAKLSRKEQCNNQNPSYERREIASSRPDVSRYCLGTMYFGTKVNERESFRLLDLYADRGGNFWTARTNMPRGSRDSQAARANV